jgi:ATP-dependent RNA helicase RhlE
VAEDYVHRIGRTGRAGATGQAVSLVSHDEFKELSAIERLIGRVLDREFIIGYEPVNNLPESRLDTRPIKPKKPKKPKAPRSEHQDGQRSGEAKRGHKPQGKNKQHVAKGDSKAGSGQSAGKRKPANGGKKPSAGMPRSRRPQAAPK